MESQNEMDRDIVIRMLQHVRDYLELNWVDEYVSHGEMLNDYSEYLLLIAINEFLKNKN